MIYCQKIEDGIKRSVGSGLWWHSLSDLLRECKYNAARTKQVGYFGIPFNLLVPYLEEKIKDEREKEWSSA